MTTIDAMASPAGAITGSEKVAHAYCTRCCSQVAACGFVRDRPIDPTASQAPRRDWCVVCAELAWARCRSCSR